MTERELLRRAAELAADLSTIRLSVSSWRTTEQDVDRGVAAFAAALA
jgi:hypothetical protein